jgi:hypothetical protein
LPLLFLRRYNADGSPRTDAEWLDSKVSFNPEWSASEAWQNGYYPDGKPRSGMGNRKSRRQSRLSIMGINELDQDFDLDDFERRARKSFAQLHPTVSDPMGILEEFVAFRKWRFVDLFYQMDRDRSGQISSDELTVSVEELGIPLTPLQLDELIFRLDLDGDDM